MPDGFEYDFFISYSHADKEWVQGELLNRLESSGFAVCIDTRDFNIGEPSLVNMERAVEMSRWVLLVLTPNWLASEWTDFESLLASTKDPAGRRRKIIPIMLKSCEPPPRISMLTYANFIDPATQAREWERLVSQLSSARKAADTPIKKASGKPVEKAFMLYDWEDRPQVRKLVNGLREKGVEIGWDQDWPFWKETRQAIEAALVNAELVVVYFSPQAAISAWLTDIIKTVRAMNRRLVALTTDASARSKVLHGELALDIAGVHPDTLVTHLIEQLKLAVSKTHPPAAPSPPLPNRVEARKLVDALLTSALQDNLYIQTDTVIDKLFLSPQACEKVIRAHEIAQGSLAGDDPSSLRATLEFGRLKRFWGDWDEAASVLKNGEMNARRAQKDPHILPLFHAFQIELGSLLFEQGDIDEVERVERALVQIKRGGVSIELVKVYRQLGNMYREQDSWQKAEKYLNYSVSIAEVLAITEVLVRDGGEPGADPHERAIRHLLWVDCLREQAALYSQQGNGDKAIKHFEDALQALDDPIVAGEKGEYLRGIILYQLGRTYHINKADIKTAVKYFEDSKEILHRYDNPVRLAFLYHAHGTALAQDRAPASRDLARHFLEKARRVRIRSGHEYFTALTAFGLADLYFSNGEVARAIREIDAAIPILNKLGKTWALGNAWYRQGSYCEMAGARDRAIECYETAIAEFQKIGLDGKIREAEFLLLKLKYGGDLKDLTLNDLLKRGKDEGYDFHLNEVGEYAFHSWIRRETDGKTPHIRLLDTAVQTPAMLIAPEATYLSDLISIGVGDDAAVMALPASNLFDLVLTTDAAPGSLCRSPQPEAGRYAAKFSVVHTLSDILAMGARPVALLLNLYLTRDATLEYAMTVVKTIVAEAAKYNVALIGGDLKERREQSIGCIALGVVEKGKALRRDSARPGQVLAMTLAGMPDGSGGRKVGMRWAQEVLEYLELTENELYTRLFNKNWKNELLFLPYKEIMAGAQTGLIRAAIDTSDGVLACLELVGRASRVSFELDEELVEAIIDERVKEVAQMLGVHPAQFLFNAGHDWEVVLTVETQDFASLQKALRQAGGDLARLGMVCNRKPEVEGGIAFIAKNSHKRILIPFFTDEKFVVKGYEERPSDWDGLKYYLDGARPIE